MENKNEIGKIFKDKLDLLDKKPGDHVWASIENDLNKKRKRRILFWLIPALLMVGIAVSTLFFMQTDGQKIDSGNVKQISTSQSNKSQNTTKSSETKKEQTIVTESNDPQNKNKSNKINKSQDSILKVTVSKGKPITKLTTGESSETKTTVKKSRTEKLVKQSSKLVASTDEYEEYEVVKKYKVIVKKNKTITTTYKKSNTKTVKTSPKKNTEHLGKKVTTKRKKPVKSSKIAPAPTIIKTTEEVDNNSDSEKNKIENKPISNTEKTEEIKKDSIAIQPQPEKKQTPKREYVKKEYPEQENETDAEYSVSVYYGPAIFGTLSNQSTINESFDDVSKSHPITSHYGFYFKTMYGKYGFKAGIAKINLKISNHLNKQSNINFDNMVFSNNDIYSVLQNDEQIRLVQKISYYEIPLEFNYAVKKDETPYGIEAFTGFSVLISDANQLYLSSNNLKSEGIGSTKDLNKMNLSFNLGLGFNYKLTEKFQLDFNPIFKYYLTSFKGDNESKPYSLSIQSGVTYKF